MAMCTMLLMIKYTLRFCLDQRRQRKRKYNGSSAATGMESIASFFVWLEPGNLSGAVFILTTIRGRER